MSRYFHLPKAILPSLGLALAAQLHFGVASAQPADAARGESVVNSCRGCHQIGEGAQNGFGPVLNDVVNRQAGTYPGYTYSPDVQAAGENGLEWTEENLFLWLEGPSNFLKGYLDKPDAVSKMPFMLANEQDRLDAAAYLATQISADMDEPMMEMTHGDAAFDMSVMETDGVVDTDPDAGLPEGIERFKQELVAPPFAPEHSQKAENPPRVIEFELVVEEKQWVLDDLGTTIVGLTYNGSIPGPLMIVHEGDYVEITLKNPSTNLMEHNIDLHASIGALGGAGITTISPGEQTVLRFKAENAGAFLYHCAPEGSMTPYHVTHGMTGSILVLPREGLTDGNGNDLTYDKLYYVGENDFYVPRHEDGSFKSYSTAAEDFSEWVKEMTGLIPSHVVFNGRVGALTGKNAMTANVGENVMFLHATGNRDTRPHMIGGIGDYVWERGAFDNAPKVNLETWLVAGGSVGAAMMEFQQPGVYVYLNHNLITAVELGAAAHVVVEGEWNEDLMKQVYIGPIKE